MTKIGCALRIRLAIRGPLLIRASESGPWGVDAIALRDPLGHLVIPGDQVQGKVREALENLGGTQFLKPNNKPWDRQAEQDASPVRGDVDDAGKANSSESHQKALRDALDAPSVRYPLQFSDFVSERTYGKPGERVITQIAIDAETGSADEGMLRVLDAPLAAGEVANFIGEIRFLVGNIKEIEKRKRELEQTFQAIHSFGSNKSVGFGRLQEVKIQSESTKTFGPDPNNVTGSDRRFIVDFSFLDPICCPEGVANGNLFESRVEIPGEALRGALAGLLQRIHGSDDANAKPPRPNEDYCELWRHFDRLRITTARPLAKANSSADPPSLLPKSLAIADKKVIDLALAPSLDAIDDFAGSAVALAPDWKEGEAGKVDRHFKVHHPTTELRVRTAIDTKRRRARQSQLFAYRSMRPEDTKWRALLTFDDRELDPKICQAVLCQAIGLLESGWLSVSKTKARGEAKVIARSKALTASDIPAPLTLAGSPTASHVYVITLRGSALMIDPRDCVEKDGAAMKSSAEIGELFEEYWKEVGGDLFAELPERRFKQDRLIGGFQGRQYRYSPDSTIHPNGAIETQKSFPYNPTLVIDAGSVFVLQVKDSNKLVEAKQQIADWCNRGLPLPKWAEQAYGTTHHRNIFLPQNGYGEIDVNLACHARNTIANPVLEMQK